MSFERNLLQEITYWAPTGTETLYGATTFEAPVVLQGRWEDKMEMILSKMGTQIVSKSRAFFAQDINIDGYIYLGTSVATDPRTVEGAFEIQGKGQTRNLRNLQSITVAYL